MSAISASTAPILGTGASELTYRDWSRHEEAPGVRGLSVHRPSGAPAGAASWAAPGVGAV